MSGYLQNTWTNGNYNSHPNCFSGFIDAQNVCNGSSYRGTSTKHLTNTLSLNYGWKQIRLSEQLNNYINDNTQTNVFKNTGIHTATLNYSLETGTVKSVRANNANDSKFTFGLGLNGGACWYDNQESKLPGYTYGGKAYIEQENIWGYAKHANIVGRMRLGAEHQGHHFTQPSLDTANDIKNPEYISTSSAELDLGLGAVRYTHFDLEMGGKIGYEYNKQIVDGNTTTFHAPKAGAYLEGKVMIPAKRGCPVTAGITFKANIDYTLDGKLYNKDNATQGNRLNYGFGIGSELIF